MCGERRGFVQAEKYGASAGYVASGRRGKLTITTLVGKTLMPIPVPVAM